MSGTYSWSLFEVDAEENFRISRVTNADNSKLSSFKINAESDHSLVLGGNTDNSGELRLLENSGNGSNYIAIKAPATIASNVILTLPTDDGTDGQFLQTNGSGTMSWEDIPTIISFIVFGQNSAITNTTVQLKTTNGSQNGQGWRMPVDGKVTHMSMQMDCGTYSSGTVTLTLYKNGSSVSKTISGDPGATGDFGVDNSITEETFSAGETLTAHLTVPSGISVDDIAVLLRIVSS